MSSQYYGNHRPEVAALLPADYRRVLEVGCGEGAFAQHLPRREFYWGVEPSGAAGLARTRLDRVSQGLWHEVQDEIPPAWFDLAVCNDVIEHMSDPEGFLASLRTKLVPGGVIVGSVPNVRYLPHLMEVLAAHDWRYRDEGILDRTHLRFFTQRSLARLLQAEGDRIEVLTGVNSVVANGRLRTVLRWRTLQLWLSLCTLRSQADTLFLQFAFRVRLPAA